MRAGPDDIKLFAESVSRTAPTQLPSQVISVSCLSIFNFMDADSTAAQNKSKKKTILEREIDMYMTETIKKLTCASTGNKKRQLIQHYFTVLKSF